MQQREDDRENVCAECWTENMDRKKGIKVEHLLEHRLQMHLNFSTVYQAWTQFYSYYDAFLIKDPFFSSKFKGFYALKIHNAFSFQCINFEISLFVCYMQNCGKNTFFLFMEEKKNQMYKYSHILWAIVWSCIEVVSVVLMKSFDLR